MHCVLVVLVVLFVLVVRGKRCHAQQTGHLIILEDSGRVLGRFGDSRRRQGSAEIRPARLAQRKNALAEAALRVMVDRASPFSD
jgi:hypothetical protein